MKKIAVLIVFCFVGAANACPPGGFGFAFSNQVLLPQFSVAQVQTVAVPQQVFVQSPLVTAIPTPFFGANVGFNSGFGFNNFGFAGAGFGFGRAAFAGGGFRGGFVGGGFGGRRVSAFSRVGPGGAVSRVRVR